MKYVIYEYEEGIKQLFEKYPNLKSKLYPNMRHEILNDKCKDMVYEDVLAFINDN